MTSLLPAVNPLLGYSSGKPVQDQSIGARVCLAAHFNFFKTAFDPCKWTFGCIMERNFGTSAPADYT